MTEVVLDTSAIIALLVDEPGGKTVLDYREVLICAVCHAEVVGRLTDWGLDDVALGLAMRQLPPHRIAAFDEGRALVAGRVRRDPLARRLSLGDRACLSLALQTNLPVLTADRAWAVLDLGVDVRLIR